MVLERLKFGDMNAQRDWCACVKFEFGDFRKIYQIAKLTKVSCSTVFPARLSPHCTDRNTIKGSASIHILMYMYCVETVSIIIYNTALVCGISTGLASWTCKDARIQCTSISITKPL